MVKIVSEKKEGYFRLSQVQKYDHDINSDNIEGIYIYSFSLNPKKYEPSGSCNMTMLNNIQLKLELLTPPLQSDGVDGFVYREQHLINMNMILMYIVNYNIFKVVAGMGGLGFAN